MKKLAYLLLIGILTLAFIEAYSNAHAARVKYTPFEESLQGTVSGGTISYPDGWLKITQQIIIGNGYGTLPGSPITFTITVGIRYNADIGKSFTLGNWTIVSSDEQSSIRGRFIGTGTEPNEFSGTFRSNDTGTGIYYHKIIYGEFQSQYIVTYGTQLIYTALWTGTAQEVG